MNEQLTENFTRYLVAAGYQPTTRKMMESCVQEFLDQQTITLDGITPTSIHSYHQYLEERPNKKRPGALSEMMIRHHLYSVKTFFDWLQQTGQIQSHPMSRFKLPKVTTKQREILTRGEIDQLFKSCETAKEKVLLSVFYGCGLRRSEGTRLKVNDINFKEGIVHVYGKGGKNRIVPMSLQVEETLQNYLIYRFALPGISTLLTNSRGKGVQGSTINQWFKKLLERTELNPSFSLHHLRHSIASHLLESGLSVEYVRDFLGHQHLESTQMYTRINSNQFKRWKTI